MIIFILLTACQLFLI